MTTDPNGLTADPEFRPRRRRLQQARLYAILDAQMPMPQWLWYAGQLIEAGVDMIQLRDKGLADRQLLERARQLARLTRPSRTLLIVNDRADLALLAQADGVHVGQDDLSVPDVRCLVGDRLLVGVSTHSVEQVREAVVQGVDYIGVGPTFGSRTKHFDHFPGMELLRHVSAQIDLPAFAIGGIEVDNLSDVLLTGCRRVAVSGALRDSDDPKRAAQRLKERLTSADQGTDNS